VRPGVLAVVHLDTKDRVTGVEVISIGGLNFAAYEMRDVLKGAILSNSAAIILVHNHPSGDTTPSREDVAVTKRVAQACGIMDINLLDHIIVSDTEHTSLLDQGLM
jgi:DNA repair protein RadC